MKGRRVAALWALLVACGRPPLPPTDSGELRALALRPGARFVWIGAHPDDETILAGALWSLACHDGAACAFILSDDGRNGSCSASSMSDGQCPCPAFARTCPEQMAAARSNEVAAAAAVFGASVDILGIDTDPASQHDSRLQQAFEAALATHPTVIVTHAPTGGYGHPLHKWVGQQMLAMWRAIPQDQQPVLAQALDLSGASEDLDPVTDTIFGNERRGHEPLWAVVRQALACFHTQIAAEAALEGSRATERSSFRLLRPGE